MTPGDIMLENASLNIRRTPLKRIQAGLRYVLVGCALAVALTDAAAAQQTPDVQHAVLGEIDQRTP